MINLIKSIIYSGFLECYAKNFVLEIVDNEASYANYKNLQNEIYKDEYGYQEELCSMDIKSKKIKNRHIFLLRYKKNKQYIGSMVQDTYDSNHLSPELCEYYCLNNLDVPQGINVCEHKRIMILPSFRNKIMSLVMLTKIKKTLPPENYPEVIVGFSNAGLLYSYNKMGCVLHTKDFVPDDNGNIALPFLFFLYDSQHMLKVGSPFFFASLTANYLHRKINKQKKKEASLSAKHCVIPYSEFTKKNEVLELIKNLQNKYFLNKLVKKLHEKDFMLITTNKKTQLGKKGVKDSIAYIILKGAVEIFEDNTYIQTLSPGSIFDLTIVYNENSKHTFTGKTYEKQTILLGVKRRFLRSFLRLK